jgi:hypothetical protein
MPYSQSPRHSPGTAPPPTFYTDSDFTTQINRKITSISTDEQDTSLWSIFSQLSAHDSLPSLIDIAPISVTSHRSSLTIFIYLMSLF